MDDRTRQLQEAVDGIISGTVTPEKRAEVREMFENYDKAGGTPDEMRQQGKDRHGNPLPNAGENRTGYPKRDPADRFSQPTDARPRLDGANDGNAAPGVQQDAPSPLNPIAAPFTPPAAPQPIGPLPAPEGKHT